MIPIAIEIYDTPDIVTYDEILEKCSYNIRTLIKKNLIDIIQDHLPFEIHDGISEYYDDTN